MKFTEILETDIIETELVIQKLNNALNKLEKLKEDEADSQIKSRFNSFMKELESELYWNEEQLQQLKDDKEIIELRELKEGFD